MATDSKLDAYLKPLEFTHDTAATLAHRLSAVYSDLALHSSDQFLATPITKLPTGKEKGEYLAIDLGGSNLRVAFVNLLGPRPPTKRKYSLHQYDERIEKYCQRSYPIGNSLKNENPEDLFAWIGDCLAEVIRARYEDEEVMPEVIPLGITFSFPMMQNTLSEATLMPMGKGFSITSNPDLGSMVMAGYARHTQASDGGAPPLPKIKLVAISNDSVATLISLAYTFADANSKAVIGLILGTGTNAAVPMPPSSLHADKVAFATKGAPASEIVVNTEWTLRGVGPTLRGLDVMTRWDDALDAALSTPGFQPFEYMTAGAYVGEVVRLATHEYLTTHLGLDAATFPEGLRERNKMDNAWLGHNVAIATEIAPLADKLNAHPTLGRTPGFAWSADTAAVLLGAERAVQRRSTLLVAAAIVALLAAIGEISLEAHDGAGSNGVAQADGTGGSAAPTPALLKRELVVAYCGGLICMYQGYERRLRADLDWLMARIAPHSNAAIVLREASEGGVIGAGVLAGTAWPPSD